MEQWTRGRRLGIDVGSVRVGVAACDPDGILASPVATVPRDQKPEPDKVPADMAEILRYADEYEAVELVVGLPINLAGQEGPAAVLIRQYADRLAEVAAPRPVVLTDERMSTATAARRLSERGVRGRRQRAVVDQAAAVEILQGWLDARRAGAVRG
ncbi:Holliday junction resolvase RuvX [Dactylosporangium sp. CS-047395]|uniref:Holliday junction resolvase RuvX n=1 Tax=Dactylosporangium sp. CS-047395 TaxID=3239936 RepID=UPI003D8A00C8